MLETEQPIFNALAEAASAELHDDYTLLEPLAALLESLTIQQLTDVSKLANKAIRKVAINEEVKVQEVAGNPLYSLHQYLVDSVDPSTSCDLLRHLTKYSHKLSIAFSRMIVNYMTEHEKQFKRELNRMAIIRKILARVYGMVVFNED